MNTITEEVGQPGALRLALYANILLWGIHLPFGLPPLNVILTLVAGALTNSQNKRMPIGLILFGFGCFAYNMVVFIAGPCTDGSLKVFPSMIMMVLLIFSVYWLASSARFGRPLLSTNEATWLLAVIAGAATLEFLIRLLSGTPIAEVRSGGLFLEPSHLALSSIPLICYLFFCGEPLQKAWGLAAAPLLLIVGYSSTLIVLLFVLIGLPHLGRLFRRSKQGSGIMILALLGFALFLFLVSSASEDTMLRVSDILDLRPESNLSSLVYVNGWMLLDHYLNSTGGVGLGFNAMGCEPRAETVVTAWLELINLGDQNYNDGSFLLSKVGSEFGILGLLAFLAMLIVALRKMLGLSREHAHPTAVICAGWLAIVFIGGLIRSGGGYFTGPVLLGLFSFFLLGRTKRANDGTPLPPATVTASSDGLLQIPKQ